MNMKRAAIVLAAAVVLSGTAFAAQLYRWVDEKGNVEYRDTPPPSTAKKVEQRTTGGRGPDTSSLPYSVQVAVKNFPVTLWLSKCGPACDQAKAHLVKRGVPYTEKDATVDVDEFTKATGSNEVPVLYVGRTQIKGYLASTYDEALDVAGYPRTPPPGSKPTAAAKPAVTAKAEEKPAATAPKPASTAKPAPAGSPDLPPVRLYTHPQCGNPCEDARLLLTGRGVGFQEVSAESAEGLAELVKVTGGKNVPVMVIGQSITRGFADTNFHEALDSAGYRR
jgi:glutaredoxin